jgi:ABC-type glycerol-3-phosphate transport system substrate-binding protein
MEFPTTPEELYDYLAACREKLPPVNGLPVIPFTMDEDLWAVGQLFSLFWPSPKNVGGDWGFDPNDGYKFYNYGYTDSEELMRAAKYVNRLYRVGLIDREAPTIKRDQYMEKISSGRVASAFMAMWDMTTFSDQAKEVVPELFYVAPPDIYDKASGYPLNPDTKWTNWVGYWSSLTVSTRLSEAQFRHFLAMLDYLATTEGQILVQVGIEGVSYEFDGSGKYFFTPDFLQKTDDLDWNKASSYGVFYYQQVVNNFLAYKEFEGVSAELQREEHMAGWVNRQSRRDRYDPDMMPYKFQYLVEGEQELSLMPAIGDARKVFYVNVLTAKDEAEVEKVVRGWAKTCVDLGIEKVIQEKVEAMANLVIPTDLDY